MCYSKCPYEGYKGVCKTPMVNVFKHDAHCCINVECKYCRNLVPVGGDEVCDGCKGELGRSKKVESSDE